MSDNKPEYEVNSGWLPEPLIGKYFEYMQLDCDAGADVDQLNKFGAAGWQVVRWFTVQEVKNIPHYKSPTSITYTQEYTDRTRYILMRCKT